MVYDLFILFSFFPAEVFYWSLQLDKSTFLGNRVSVNLKIALWLAGWRAVLQCSYTADE